MQIRSSGAARVISPRSELEAAQTERKRKITYFGRGIDSLGGHLCWPKLGITHNCQLQARATGLASLYLTLDFAAISFRVRERELQDSFSAWRF